MADRVCNVRITGTAITFKEHGVLTFHIFFEGQATGGIGGYVIGHGYLGAEKFTASVSGLVAMMHIMNTVGVETWEELKGQYVRIVDPGLGGVVTKIGNIIKDKWFDLDAFFTHEKAKAELEREGSNAG